MPPRIEQVLGFQTTAAILLDAVDEVGENQLSPLRRNTVKRVRSRS